MFIPQFSMRNLTMLLASLSMLASFESSLAAGRVFYDGFEGGTTNNWQQAPNRNPCKVVTTSTDGVSGPFTGSRMASCNWNGQVVWNDPAAFESLMIPTSNYNDELFIRVMIRIDQNFSAGAKLLRIYTGSHGLTLYESTGSGGGSGLKNEAAIGGNALTTYYGGAPGDQTHSDRSSWHKIEYYFKQSTGAIKVWHDGILVRNNSGLNFQGLKWSPLYITSNAAHPFDATNQIYFDEVEVFSDVGTGATGNMSDASIRMGPTAQVPPPPNVRLTP